MSDVKYLSVIPLNPNESDRLSKVAIRGSLLPGADTFSINFVNSPSDADNITYHFKVRIQSQTIIENYKINGIWSESHMEQYLNIFDRKDDNELVSALPKIIDGIDDSIVFSSNQASFSLLFQLDYDNSAIHVYQVREDGQNFITRYETFFSLSDIKSIQVWGEVKKIHHFSLNYE